MHQAAEDTFPEAATGFSLQAPGLVSAFIDDALESDEALQVDCGEMPPGGGGFVFPSTPASHPYMQGFLIIESRRSLDVTAIYSAGEPIAGPGPAKVKTIAVEQIGERRIDDD